MASRLLKFRIDTGDHEVGVMRWRFHVPKDVDGVAALNAALRDWVATEGVCGDDISMIEALDCCPDEIFLRHGLARVHLPEAECVDLDDGLLTGFLA